MSSTEKDRKIYRFMRCSEWIVEKENVELISRNTNSREVYFMIQDLKLQREY